MCSSETATLGVGSGADVKWNDSTGSCDSDAREGCLEYKENLRAFYKSVHQKFDILFDSKIIYLFL